MRRADMICSTWIKTLGSVSFAHRSLFTKIVLHRIISIVRFLTVQCNLDRSINRDDDEKRSPLIVRHVEGFVYVTICRRRLMKVPFPPITREMEEVIAFWAVSCIDWSRSEQHKETDMNMILSWKRYQRWRQQGRSSRILYRRHYSCSVFPLYTYSIAHLSRAKMDWVQCCNGLDQHTSNGSLSDSNWVTFPNPRRRRFPKFGRHKATILRKAKVS